MPETIPINEPPTKLEKLVAFASVAFDCEVTLEPGQEAADSESTAQATQTT